MLKSEQSKKNQTRRKREFTQIAAIALPTLLIAAISLSCPAYAAGDPNYDCTECHTTALMSEPAIHTVHDLSTTWGQFVCDNCHSPGFSWPNDPLLYSQCNICHDNAIHP